MSTIIATLATRGRQVFAPTAVPRWLSAVLAVALVAAGLQAVAAGAAMAAVSASGGASGNGEGPAPVSSAFAMGGGVAGSIDQRTGAFQASVPLVNVAGRAGDGLSLVLTYNQSLAQQGSAGDPFGLGSGWTLGVPWVDTVGGVRVYPASGGSYEYDADSPTGLRDYPLRDLKFADDAGTTTPPPGVAKRPYAYTLTYLDGTVDRFDADGNLIEEVDRFGNAIDLTWQQSGPWQQPTSVTDSYGQVTTFDYDTAGEVRVISPVNAEKITAVTTLTITDGRLQAVTGPLDQQTSFGYTPVAGLPAADELLQTVTSPTGEQATATYTSLAYEPGVVTVHTVDVTGPQGEEVLPELRFDINPSVDADQHNYTGFPTYNKDGPNGLFNSGDFGYRYTTELADGTSRVYATYDSLQLLVKQQVILEPPGPGRALDQPGTDQGLNQEQTYAYPPVTSLASLPPNYAKPTSVAVVYGDPDIGTGATRTVITKSEYDDRGLQTSDTNAAGTTTSTIYNSYGLPASQTVTGADGDTSITANTFSDDGKTIATATTAVGVTDAEGKVTARPRTVASYSYNRFGQVTGESVAWAKGAKPAGDSGPGKIDDAQQISTDTAAHTQTDVVTTAAGTPGAQSTTTVTDLVTGEVLAQTSPGNLTTSYTYDALGRQLTETAPGGQITRTVYNSPTQTTVTAPSGLKTQTTTDVTGRIIKITDNVSGEKLVASPQARTVETDHYSPDGIQATTTTPAGTTTTTFDPLGRPVEIVRPDGITETDSYNDVANTQTVSLVPAGAKLADPVAVTKNGFDDLNQPTSSSTSYPDGTPQAPAAETYDGLGRVAAYNTDGLTAKPDYGGAGGLQTGTTLTPGDTSGFPGRPAESATDNTMTGALTSKTLTSKALTGQAPAVGTTYRYDAAGRVATATTADGAVTSYTYTPAGQIATVTQPSGTVTSYTYSPQTGRLDQVDMRAAGGRTQDTGYTYYPDTGQVKSVYDPAHPADAIRYDYDADGQLVAVDYPDGTSTKASYDDNGDLASTTDITGAVTSYTYNSAGTCGPAATDLCAAVQARGGVTLAKVAYTYDAMDRVHTITRGNGVATTIDYTDASQVKTERTTAADGRLLRTDAYSYDSHGNVATHTITSAQTAGVTTTTTLYRYDAYDRLLSSAVYPGATAIGTPTTTTTYTLDAAGNVTGQQTTAGGTTTHVVNTISPGGELTARTTDGVKTDQKFDADGNVTTDLSGDTYTYDPDGQQASVTTPAGITTSYTYWPDGTRRSATTVTGGTAHTITYHYSTTGELANDSYTGGGPDTVTASYLLAVSREARTLDTTTTTGPGTAQTTGPGTAQTTGPGTAQTTGPGTAQTTGPGTGYYLVDPHGSVTAMTDASGQVTASYAYTDYGAAAGANPALLPVPAATPAGNAAVSPFSYDGYYTNPTTGTQYLPARSYDPTQGRFLSADAADQFNRYQAFDANPITDTDPTGQWAFPEILTEAFSTALFIALGFLSGGAAAPVFAAVAAGEQAFSAITASVVFTTVAAVSNVGAAAVSATLTANAAASLTGHGFLSASDKENLGTASVALSTIGGFAGVAAGVAASFPEAETATETALAVDEQTVGQTVTQPEAESPVAPTTPEPPVEPELTGSPASDAAINADVNGYVNNEVIPGAGNTAEGTTAGPGQVSQIPVDTNLAVVQVTPEGTDPSIAEFNAQLRETGQNPNLNDPPTEVPTENLPGVTPASEELTLPGTASPGVVSPDALGPGDSLKQATSAAVTDIMGANNSDVTPQGNESPLDTSAPGLPG